MAEEQQRQRGKGQAQAGEAKRQQWFPLPGLAGSGMPPGAGSQRDLQQATSSPSLPVSTRYHSQATKTHLKSPPAAPPSTNP